MAFEPDIEAIGTPDDESLCRLFGYHYSGGFPVPSVRVVVQIENPPQASDDVVFDSTEQEVTTDEAGLWKIDLVRQQTYLLTITRAGINRLRIGIPDEEVYNVAQLL